MNAMWYNVPQSRERLIFIGVRNDLNIGPCFPKPEKHFITFNDAVKGCKKDVTPKLAESIQKFCHKLKPGQNLYDVGGKGFQTVRIYGNRVCPALTKIKAGIGFGMLIHPTEDRVLSIPEMKRISTFPDSFKFTKNWIDAKQRIGNAVMPNMMKAIALNIKTSILQP